MTLPKISTSRVDLNVIELAHEQLLPASTLFILPLATTMSSVPSLVLYAYVFIGRVSSETRYLTENWGPDNFY